MKQFAFLALVFTAVAPLCSAQHNFPRSSYESRKIEGFTILEHERLRDHPAEARAAIDELTAQLKAIVRAVPTRQLSAFRKVPIWVEWEIKPGGAAEFHPSAAWLKENGYNPEKAGAVEISNARNFVDWSRRAQPWMVLHELAHAFQFRVLGEDHRGIEAAYQSAIEAKRYDSVEYFDGTRRKAYATTDAKEYFAEISEAYLGRNDFFPFSREELREHDPAGFRLMREVWGEPAAPSGKPPQGPLDRREGGNRPSATLP